jgi:hypothetical protein
MSGWRAIAVSLLVVLGLAQKPADLTSYRQALEDYRAGTPITERGAASITSDPSVAARVADAPSGWAADALAAAAMLHTDVALRLVRQQRPQDAAAQLDAAATLLRAAVQRDPLRLAFARRWRSTVAALVHAFGAPDLSERLRSEEMGWLNPPERAVEADPPFQLGLASEIHAAVAGPLSGPPPRKAVAVTREARAPRRRVALSPPIRMPRSRPSSVASGSSRPRADARSLRIAASKYACRLISRDAAPRASSRAAGGFGDAETQYRAAIDLFGGAVGAVRTLTF